MTRAPANGSAAGPVTLAPAGAAPQASAAVAISAFTAYREPRKMRLPDSLMSDITYPRSKSPRPERRSYHRRPGTPGIRWVREGGTRGILCAPKKKEQFMRTFAAIVFVVATMSLSVDPARAWSVRDEVTVSDPGLTATLVWEVINSASFCQSSPANLDRLSCTVIPDPAEFWFGLDAAGNAYGTVNVTDATGEHFDIFRRPVGTKQSQAIARVTKRKEPVFGQVTKMQLTLGSAIDTTGGVLLIALTGSCSTSACVAQGDTSDHLGVVKISGLPTLFDLALT